MMTGPVVLAIARGVAWPTISTALNMGLGEDSSVRATVLSVFSGAARLASAATGGMVGHAATLYC